MAITERLRDIVLPQLQGICKLLNTTAAGVLASLTKVNALTVTHGTRFTTEGHKRIRGAQQHCLTTATQCTQCHGRL